MPSTVSIEVAPGELVDKLTILEIKLARMNDANKRRNVALERDLLSSALQEAFAADEVTELRDELRAVNETLWDIEDEIRDCERRGDFGSVFVALARAVYKTNDERASIKRTINVALGSRILEEKSYTPYA